MENESDAQVRLDKNRKELAATETEYFVMLRALLKENPRVAAKFFFEALLKKGDLSNNPVTPLFRADSDVDKRLWGDVAEIALSKLSGEKKERQEYVPLTQLIEESFNYSNSTIQFEADRAQDRHDFKRRVLRMLEKEFASATLTACMLVNQGMPVFRHSESGAFVQTSTENMDVAYIFMKGHYYDLTPSGNHQEWAKNYYFKNEHLLVHRKFFDGFEGGDEVLRLRRDAFRAHIGAIDHQQDNGNAFFSGRQETKLMKILRKVLVRYYGDQFSEDDPETWTTQSEIVDWLRKECDLSEREATSIDVVTRPDMARRK